MVTFITQLNITNSSEDSYGIDCFNKLPYLLFIYQCGAAPITQLHETNQKAAVINSQLLQKEKKKNVRPWRQHKNKQTLSGFGCRHFYNLTYTVTEFPKLLWFINTKPVNTPTEKFSLILLCFFFFQQWTHDARVIYRSHITFIYCVKKHVLMCGFDTVS